MKKTNKNKLDKLWSKTIRDNFQSCVLCDETKYLNAHHYVGRRNLATRWYIPNGVLLCPKHHTFGIRSAHQDPEWFRQQMLELWGEKWLKDLIKKSNEAFTGTYEDVLKHLKGV